ncbi:MAG: MFS transporter [Candidatus Marinimicrobia bacterium]|nr:MFS transporter [Candidatus Neomarinimicrobiota bacterium]
MHKFRSVFIAACIGQLLFGIVMISLGTINTFLTDKFALTELTIASLAALLPFGILIGSLVFGPVVDRFGYKIVLILCTLLIAAAIEGIAFAPALGVIQIAFFIIGFSGGAINGSTNALVADISITNKGAQLSLLGVFYGIGALGMPAVLGIMSKFFDYTNVVKVTGIVVLLPLIYFCLVSFPEPKHKQGFPIKKSLLLLKDTTLILIGCILFFESGMEGIINNWTTTYLQDVVGVDSSRALFALSYLIIALTLTRLILGGLLRHIPAYIVLIISFIGIFVGAGVMRLSIGYTGNVLGLIIIGIGFAAGFPVLLGYVGEIYADLSGTAFSIVFVIALMGNTLINYFVGIIAHNFGIQHYLSILLIAVVLMLILLSIVLKKISSKIKI